MSCKTVVANNESKIFSFSCGWSHTIGMTSIGEVYVWGNNGNGELGLDHTKYQTTPQLLSAPKNLFWKNFACGWNHTIGITSTGDVYVWGGNGLGHLSLNNTQKKTTPQLLSAPNNSLWKDFVCGLYHTIGITVTGEAYMWGYGLDNNKINIKKQITPQLLSAPNNSSWDNFVSGWGHIIGITSSGAVYVWGNNEWGQLGLNDTTKRTTPELFHSSVLVWRKFFCGWYHTIGMTSIGEVYVWGNNGWGQLGLGHTEHQNTPQLLLSPNNSPWKDFVCGWGHTIGITSDGKAYVWGNNTCGQLGLGHTLQQTVPQLLSFPKISSWKNFVCGWNHTIGMTFSGEVYVWGDNACGQLGLGHTKDQTTPQLLLSPTFPWLTSTSLWLSSIKRSQVDLSKLLESREFADQKIITKDQFEQPIHSALIFSHCPQLLEQSPLDLSKNTLLQLLQMIYGASVTSSSSSVLMELYHFIQLHQLIDFEMEVFQAIVKLMNEQKNLFEILQLTEQLQLKDIQNIAFAHIPFLSPKPTEEELNQILNQLNLSRKTEIQVLRIHTNPLKAPKMKKKTLKKTKMLVDHLKFLLESGQGSDFTIIVGDTCFPVHQFVLGFHNKYFQALFQSHTSESAKRQVNLSETSLSVFSMKKMLSFLYCGVFSPVTITESFEILMAKDYFLLEDDSELISVCKGKFETGFSLDNCLEVLQVALKWNQHEIFEQAMDMVMSNIQLLSAFYQASPDWTAKLAFLLVELLQKK